MKSSQTLKSLLVALGVGLFGSVAQAATGVGPYYATASWDQTLPASTRVLVLTNMNSEAVLDRETGIVWERTTDKIGHFGTAHNDCNSMAKGGRKGWRVPSLQEFASLIDPTVPARGPTLPAGHPFQVQAGVY